MREDLTDDYYANRAVKQVLREGLFKSEEYTEFNCNRVMDSLNEFRLWLMDFVDRGNPSQNSLLEKVERAYQNTSGKKKIIVHAPLMLRRLRNSMG